jgi:hypothetical protein
MICLILLSSRAQMLGLQPDTWESVSQISDIPALIFGMRNVLHLAASLSPLIVLVPKKFALETIRRDHLLAVRLIFLMWIRVLIGCHSIALRLEIRSPQFSKT